MIHAERVRLFEKAVECFGIEAQENMCIEECAELIQAINKKHRRIPSNIAEEIADVEIMLEQVKLINRCGTEVERIKTDKLVRLSAMVEREKNNNAGNDINATD